MSETIPLQFSVAIIGGSHETKGAASIGKHAFFTRATTGKFEGSSKSYTFFRQLGYWKGKVANRNILLSMFLYGSGHGLAQIGGMAPEMMIKEVKHAFLILFDITNQKSFEIAKNRYQELSKCNRILILIGTKKDLENQRNVKEQEVRKWANENGIMYFEVSAFTGENMELLFEKMVSKLIQIFPTGIEKQVPKVEEKLPIIHRDDSLKIQTDIACIQCGYVFWYWSTKKKCSTCSKTFCTTCFYGKEASSQSTRANEQCKSCAEKQQLLEQKEKKQAGDEDGIVWGKMLGSGGQGAVFSITFNSTQYAAKRILMTGSEIQNKKLLAEISVMEKISHKNLLPLVKKIIKQNEIILILPLYSGSLSQELKIRDFQKNPFTPKEMALIFYQIVDGLCYLHNYGQKGIAHRDLKSENILIRYSEEDRKKIDNLVICDFGISKELDTGTAITFGGTSRWLAPEVYQVEREESLEDKKYDAKKSDVWSLGCLLFEILTLHPPYSGIAPFECEKFVMSGIRPMLQMHKDQIPPQYWEDKTWISLVDIFEKCVVVDPNQRLTSLQILETLKPLVPEIKESTEEIVQLKMKELREGIAKANEEDNIDLVVQLALQLQTYKKTM